MRVNSARLFLLLATVLTMSISGVAQEGHPMTGTWYGDFGPSPAVRHDLTVVMSWDGTKVNGTVNPGPTATPLKAVTVNIQPGVAGRGAQAATATTPEVPAVQAVMPVFLLKFEVDAKNKAGGTDTFVFEGRMENPVAGNRVIRGTWTCGNQRGDFRIYRD